MGVIQGTLLPLSPRPHLRRSSSPDAPIRVDVPPATHTAVVCESVRTPINDLAKRATEEIAASADSSSGRAYENQRGSENSARHVMLPNVRGSRSWSLAAAARLTLRRQYSSAAPDPDSDARSGMKRAALRRKAPRQPA